MELGRFWADTCSSGRISAPERSYYDEIPPLGREEGSPTGKGIKIRVEQFPELEKGIKELGKAIAKGGMSGTKAVKKGASG